VERHLQVICGRLDTKDLILTVAHLVLQAAARVQHTERKLKDHWKRVERKLSEDNAAALVEAEKLQKMVSTVVIISTIIMRVIIIPAATPQRYTSGR
jgi:hypothetical protein